MAHLVDYENASTELEAALAALKVVRAMSSKNLAWQWVERAVKHALACGVTNARELVGYGRWPDTGPLELALKQLNTGVTFVLANAFSINMVERKAQQVKLVPVSTQAVQGLLRNEKWISAVGHENTAEVLSGMLGVNIQANRISVVLDDSHSLIVAQYSGPRLPEGATELPADARIEFWQVYLA